MKHHPFLAFALLAPAALATFQAEPEFKEAQHKSAGKVIGEWIEANVKNKGIAEAREKMWDELSKWEKKAKRDPLALTADLEQALWYSLDYDKTRTKKGSVEEIEVGEGSAAWTYTVHLPAKYKTADGPYPLLMLVPPRFTDGRKAKDWLVQDWTEGDVRDGAVIVVVHMPEDLAVWTETFAPDKSIGGVGAILRTFGEVKNRYAIDFDRVFLIGRLEGLQPAMIAANSFPDRFAGIAGRSGDIAEGFSAKNFKNLPTWFSGPGPNVTAFSEQVTALGYGNCTVLPEGKEGHLWNWVQATVRNANPEEIVLDPGTPFPNRSYWLEIPTWDGAGTVAVKARVDKATNTIHVDGSGVGTVTIHFNDRLLDLDREVRVVCNGVTHTDVIPRSKTVLERTILSSRSDPGKLYVCTKDYDLPAVANAGGEGN